LVRRGGHNPLEPAQFGVPIVMGPHYVNFRAITEDLLKHQGLRITGKEELAGTLIELLKNTVEAGAMGERARRVFDEQAGATDRCVEALRGLLPNPASNVPGLGRVDPAIASKVRELNEEGSGIEAVLAFLRENGVRQLESIAILRSVLGVPLAEGKRAIYESATWRDSREAQDAELEKLVEELNGMDDLGRPKQD